MKLKLRARRLGGPATLGVVLAAAVWLPLPVTGNTPVRNVIAEVHERLPGWVVVRADSSWEGAYTVVATCGIRAIGFQLVPEHGLPVGDAWIQPNDAYSASRLALVSDHDRYLVWFSPPISTRQLSCNEELAQTLRSSAGPPRRVD